MQTFQKKIFFSVLIFYMNNCLEAPSRGPDLKIGSLCSIQSCCCPEKLLLHKTCHSCLLSERDLLPNSLLLSLSAVATEGPLLLPCQYVYSELRMWQKWGFFFVWFLLCFIFVTIKSYAIFSKKANLMSLLMFCSEPEPSLLHSLSDVTRKD